MTRENAYPALDASVLQRLEQIKAKGGLPSPKGPAMAIIRLAKRESTSLPVLAHAIKADPTFSVRLIKVADGVSGAEQRPVVSVRAAVAAPSAPRTDGPAAAIGAVEPMRILVVGDKARIRKPICGALKDEMREQDVLARTGGDEFLVICPDTTLEAAVVCAERMRAAVESLPIVCGARKARGSVSVGVALRDAATLDPDALIRLADQGAYLAKRRRNTVATVQPTMPVAARSA